MEWDIDKIVLLFKEKGKLDLLAEGKHGIERETLRTNFDGSLALTPHPKSLGSSFTDPFITTDFSESQLELVTKPEDSVENVIGSLNKIHKKVVDGLDNELMWPFSMPCLLPEEGEIPIAYYGESEKAKKKVIYRRGIAKRHGTFMQMLSGIHYNFSFTDEFWKVLYSQFGVGESFDSFKNEKYLELVRNFIKYRWLLVYLTAASPIKDLSYSCRGLGNLDLFNAISLRLSRCGYDNSAKIDVSYNKFQEYLDQIENATKTIYPPYSEMGLYENGVQVQLNDNLLQIVNEYYFPIRLKPVPSDLNFLEGLKKTGVSYIELRLFDVNPFSFEGVSERDLRFGHLFVLWCLLKGSKSITALEVKEGSAKQQFLALTGRNGLPDQSILEGRQIFEEMISLVKYFGDDYRKDLDFFKKEFENPVDLSWKKIIREMEEKGLNLIEYGLSLAKNHLKNIL